MNYADVDDEPKPRPAKFPRIDDPAGAHGRAAATVDPDTKLENLDSKYDNDDKARNRAIRFVVRTRSLPASYLRFLERRQRRRRTAVRASIATTRAPDAFIFFARRRRCGTTTSPPGSKRTRCSGARSARSGTRGARPRPRLRLPRASAGRWRITNPSASARRAPLRARRATTSPTPSRRRRRRRPSCLPREAAGAGVSASPVRRRTRRAVTRGREVHRAGRPLDLLRVRRRGDESVVRRQGRPVPPKPVCKICYESQVRRAYHSLASIVCILSALPVFVADASVMFLHSSPLPAATAFAARSPVRTRA
jgi:hypothetical protein